MNLGTTLRDIRKRKKINQKDLAREANISQTYISQIESGKRLPSIETLEKLGIVLGIPFQVISFMSLDADSVPESKRDDFNKYAPPMLEMVEQLFFSE